MSNLISPTRWTRRLDVLSKLHASFEASPPLRVIAAPCRFFGAVSRCSVPLRRPDLHIFIKAVTTGRGLAVVVFKNNGL